jgi:hypothetical protein
MDISLVYNISEDYNQKGLKNYHIPRESIYFTKAIKNS